jgi:hypothetical protein
MMRDGDVDGIWKLQDKAFTWASFLRSTTMWDQQFICSSAGFFGFIPWVAPFVEIFTYFSGDFVKYRLFGAEMAAKRGQKGSQYKDLFYHLVRLHKWDRRN